MSNRKCTKFQKPDRLLTSIDATQVNNNGEEYIKIYGKCITGRNTVTENFQEKLLNCILIIT